MTIIHCQERKESKALDPELAQILILCNRKFKITVIKILKDLVEWVDSMQKLMGNFSRDRNHTKKTNENSRKFKR